MIQKFNEDVRRTLGLSIMGFKDYEKIKNRLPLMVIGDIMVDEYYSAANEKETTETGYNCPVYEFELVNRSFGGAGNTALNCAYLGNDTKLFGIFEDSYDLPDHPEFDVIGFPDNRVTTRKCRYGKDNELLFRIDHEDTDWVSKPVQKLLLDEIEECLEIEGQHIVIISDYFKGLCNPNFTQSLITLFKKFDCPIIVDPKGKNWEKYKGSDIIKCNLNEFLQDFMWDWDIGCSFNNLYESIGEAVDKFHSKFDCHLIITVGEDGSLVFPHGRKGDHIPAIPALSESAIGAGDLYAAALATSIAIDPTKKHQLFIPISFAHLVVSSALDDFKTLSACEDQIKRKIQEMGEIHKHAIFS